MIGHCYVTSHALRVSTMYGLFLTVPKQQSIQAVDGKVRFDFVSLPFSLFARVLHLCVRPPDPGTAA